MDRLFTHTDGDAESEMLAGIEFLVASWASKYAAQYAPMADADFEDMRQELFLVAMNCVRRHDPTRARLTTLFCAAAWRWASRHFNTNHRKAWSFVRGGMVNVVGCGVGDGDDGHQLADPSTDPVAIAIHRETLAAVRDAIETIPDDTDRELVRRTQLGGETIFAASRGLPFGEYAACKRIGKSRALLRESLAAVAG